MTEEKTVPLEGESILGRYMVAVLQQFPNGRWEPGMMQLSATVTRYRLLLQPSPFRKRYRPACLPATHIKNVQMVKRGGYHTVAITMPTNHILYLIMSTGKLEDLYNRLASIRLPQRVQFDERVARQDIERLIGYFAGSVLHDASS